MTRTLKDHPILHRLDAAVVEAEAAFHVLVVAMSRRAMSQGLSPEQIRQRIVRLFLQEPTFRQADPYEQERVVSGIQRAISEALETADADGKAEGDDEASAQIARDSEGCPTGPSRESS